MRLTALAISLVSIFYLAPALAIPPHCDAAATSTYFQNTLSQNSFNADSEWLVSAGQYWLALDSIKAPLPLYADKLDDQLPNALRAIYRGKQVCGAYNGANAALIAPYVELIGLMDATVDSDELLLLVQLWSEKYDQSTLALDYFILLNEIAGEPAVLKVQTVLLLMKNGINSIISKQLVSSFSELDVNIIYVDAENNEQTVDDLIEYHLADVVITDLEWDVAERNADRVFTLGKGDDARWSLSFENEFKQYLEALQQRYPDEPLMVYSIGTNAAVNAVTPTYPNIIVKEFNSYADANSYFNPKICKRENKDCISTLNGQLSLVVGDNKETVFINTFLRVAQDATQKELSDARVYITSMATWAGIGEVEKRDLQNTMIFDSPRLSKLGIGYSQSARIESLMRDVITIYELKSLGIEFENIPFFGYSGTYHIVDGQIRRELSIMPFRDFIKQ